MGHIIFLVLHALAIWFGLWALVFTLPLHLIYSAIRANRQRKHDVASLLTHVRCPDCRELVLKSAKVCKHCGCRLIPQ